MDNPNKSSEYALLLREHQDLVAEHERLEATPYNEEAHIEHRRRLITHNKRLHDFIVVHFTGPKRTERTPAPDKRPRRGVRRGKTKKATRSGRRR